VGEVETEIQQRSVSRCGQEIKKRLRRKTSQPPSDVDAGNAACAAQCTAARVEVDWSTCWLAGGASQFLNRGGWVVCDCVELLTQGETLD
jgi:hypothetical protein